MYVQAFQLATRRALNQTYHHQHQHEHKHISIRTHSRCCRLSVTAPTLIASIGGGSAIALVAVAADIDVVRGSAPMTARAGANAVVSSSGVSVSVDVRAALFASSLDAYAESVRTRVQ
jgi:hypothetical protein